MNKPLVSVILTSTLLSTAHVSAAEQGHDPMANYYETYFAISDAAWERRLDARSISASKRTASKKIGQTYDNHTNHYDTFYGLSESVSQKNGG